MPATLQRVRFKLAWQDYQVGDEITPNAAHRDWLIANGYCELLPEKGAGVRSKAKAATEAVGGLFTR
jgi:hypothetical protein